MFAGWNEVPADAQCNLSHGNYDTAEFAWVNTFDGFGNFYYSYESSQIPTDENGGAGSNYTRLNSPEMDALLKELYSATDPAVAADIIAGLQRLHSEDPARGGPVLPQQRPRCEPDHRQLPPEPGHGIRHVEHRGLAPAGRVSRSIQIVHGSRGPWARGCHVSEH